MDKKELTKLVSYFIMGDGGAYIIKKNAKFIMNMRAENKDYIDWVDNVFSTFVGTKQYNRKDYNTDGYVRKPQIRIETATHPFITTIRNRIYTEGYKGIDPHALKLLDWESMAILYMCDGCLHEEKPNPKKGLKNSSWNLTLNMKRLSYGDQLLLKQAIRDKLGVEFNINRHGVYYYMRLRSRDVSTFCEGVRPYIKDSFSYKIRMLDPLNKGGDIV